MLVLKSFDFKDEKGMNACLRENRLAKGASVFVSDGKIIIPIENGEPMSRAQMIISIQEQKNTILEQTEIIIHSQKVLEVLIKNATGRVGEAEADLNEAIAHFKNTYGKRYADSEEKYQRELAKTNPDFAKAFEKRDEADKKFTAAKNALGELKDQHTMNAMEIARLTLNVELFDARIKELKV